MKNKTLIPLIFLMLFGVLSAQNKDLVGSYKGRGGGIFLFPNKMFALYGYMTMIPGTYEVLPDGIVLFKPKKSPLFLVYGNHNKNLKPDEVRIRFANFEDGKNYLQYENGKTFSVFNENPNCLPSRYVHTFSKKEIGNTLTLIADFSNELPLLTQGLKNTARFTLNDNNDFLIWYGERSHYQIDGAGTLVEKEGHTCLIFINVGTLEQNQEAVRSIKKQIKKIPIEELSEFAFAKEDEDEVDKELEEMLRFDVLNDPQAMYMELKDETVSSDIEDSFLQYDASKNVYKDPYNNIEYHKFKILELQQSTTDLKKLKIEPQTIFHYECEQPSKRRIYGTSN